MRETNTNIAALIVIKEKQLIFFQYLIVKGKNSMRNNIYIRRYITLYNMRLQKNETKRAEHPVHTYAV